LPFVLGYFGNYLPLLLANLIAVRYVIYLEFKASVKIAVAVGAFLIYYLLLIVLSVLMGNFMLLFFILLLPFFGYYSLIYREYFKKWKSFRSLNQVNEERLERLKSIRKTILDILNSK
jgi:hypothetical protein